MKLEDHKNREPFSTPDGYFEELGRNIIEATSKAPASVPAKKRITLGWWTRTIGYAAILAIAVFIADRIAKSDDTASGKAVATNNTQEEQMLDNEMIDNILTNYPIDDYTFYCYLTDTDID